MSAPRTAPAMDLAALIADPTTRIVVCCGAGGVGKTTTSAALALAAAEAGRKVVVLTIDPARRLAQAWVWPSWTTSPGGSSCPSWTRPPVASCTP